MIAPQNTMPQPMRAALLMLGSTLFFGLMAITIRLRRVRAAPSASQLNSSSLR